MSTGASESLTDEAYWSKYYGHYRDSAPVRDSIVAVGSRFDDCWRDLKEASGDGSSVFELGCYPGRYLSYVASKYGLKALGLDFNPDSQTVIDHLELMGVRDYEFQCGDFLTVTPVEKASMVFSLGLVEHFENVGEVLERHLEFLTEHGALFIAVPNMRGLIHPYKLLADRENLRMHNLEAMRPSVFHDFAARNGLKTHYIRYQGSFPWRLHHSPNAAQRLLFYAARFLGKSLDPLLNRHPSSLYSGELVALFSR